MSPSLESLPRKISGQRKNNSTLSESYHIRESVDSLCRDGADMTCPLFQTEWLRTQMQQLQAIIDTYTYSTSGFVPTKTHKVHKIHNYNDLQKLPNRTFGFFVHHHLILILLQLNWPTAKVAQVLSMVFTQNGSFPLRA